MNPCALAAVLVAALLAGCAGMASTPGSVTPATQDENERRILVMIADPDINRPTAIPS